MRTQRRRYVFTGLTCAQALHTLTVRVYWAQELLAKMPKLPAKTWTRVKDEEFVEKRRAGLEELLQGLLRVEHMTSNPDLLFFLGMLSDMPAGGGGSAAKLPPSSAPKAAPAELTGGGAAAPPEPAQVDDDDDDDAL